PKNARMDVRQRRRRRIRKSLLYLHAGWLALCRMSWGPFQEFFTPRTRRQIRKSRLYLYAGWRGLKRLFQGVAVGIAVLYLLLFVAMWGSLILAPTYKLGYFLKYSFYGFYGHGASASGNAATWDQVFISPRPHDCEWETAPLGFKHCHYDPVVQ